MARHNNGEIFRRFAQNDVGHKSSTGAVTSRRADNGDGLLFSYRALIGHYDHETERISVFEGWRGFSTTTSGHLTIFKKEADGIGVDYVTFSAGRPRHNVWGNTPELRDAEADVLSELA